MKRLKVILRRDALLAKNETSAAGFMGQPASLVDADTGEVLGPVGDFTINVPIKGVIWVTATILVSEIVVK